MLTDVHSGELGYRLKVLALVDEPVRFLTFAACLEWLVLSIGLVD